jgi:H+/Cl- antiporter ClcA
MRLILEQTQSERERLYTYLKTAPPHATGVWIIALIVLGLLLGLAVKCRPMIHGGGVPQIKGYLQKKLTLRWPSELLLKWVCSILVLSSGLSLGREGPSVQIGAYVGIAVLAFARRGDAAHHTLVCSASAAGLSAAFNAPLSGVIFVLEELQTSVQPLFLACALGASVAADAATSIFFGLDSGLELYSITVLPYAVFPWILLLGVICAILGDLFKRILYGAQVLYEKLRLSPVVRPVLPLLVSVPIGFLLFDATGGGHDLILDLLRKEYPLTMLGLLLAVKILFTALSFGSDVSGGIFLPVLSCGALIGVLFGKVLILTGFLVSDYYLTFLLLGMAAFFATGVKAPVTGIILVLELTANMNHFISLVCVVFSSLITSEIIRSSPVYTILLKRIVQKPHLNHP